LPDTAVHLLVVDDNAANRDILQRHLKKQGYSSTAASDGIEGLRLLAGGGFDLVLLDVMMPGLDGFETLQRIKADPAMRDVPVIMMSALDETTSVVRCVKMGAEDYMMKPFDPVLLGARIGASLEKKRLRDELVVQENLASLGALTAGIAHEIRNPLNFITNFASASRELLNDLRENPGSPEASAELMRQLDDYLQKIDEHGKRADRIVRGMLMHSRGKSGDPEMVDLKNLLADCVNLAYHAARAQDREFNSRIDTDTAGGMMPIRAVPQEISRVFLNILNNAFYAVRERRRREGSSYQPAVSVRACNLGDGVEIRILDNGSGIPPEVLSKIFNPFFTTKPAGAGTGLGLSLSHDIVVRGHHGTIRAESQAGVSTEFIVTLPAGAPEAPPRMMAHTKA
jgi:two-component system NtrC family sensor kinase